MNTSAVAERQTSDAPGTEPVTYVDPMIAMIERIATDPSIPLDRLEKVLAMRGEEEDRVRRIAREDEALAAKKAYLIAMSACQSELPVVTKNQKNDHTNSTYADLAAIETAAMPVIHKHGFSVSFQPDGYNEKGELRIKWSIGHAGGHVIDGVGEVPIDATGSQGKVNKTGTQAWGSTATYGRRYLLCLLFNIITGDDRDGNAPKDSSPLSDDQVDAVEELMSSVAAEKRRDLAEYRAEFLDYMKAESVGAIPARQFAKAMNALKSDRAAK